MQRYSVSILVVLAVMSAFRAYTITSSLIREFSLTSNRFSGEHWAAWWWGFQLVLG